MKPTMYNLEAVTVDKSDPRVAVLYKKKDRIPNKENELVVLGAMVNQFSWVNRITESKNGDLVITETHGNLSRARDFYKFMGLGMAE